jgi:hypothetical protein
MWRKGAGSKAIKVVGKQFANEEPRFCKILAVHYGNIEAGT